MRGLLNADKARFLSDNAFEIPDLVQIDKPFEPCKFIDFDVASSCSDPANTGVHFYTNDYKIERFWANPDKYISMLSRFKYVVMPDFSLYFDFPQALQIFNKYRSHWLAAYCTLNNISVIPNISISTPNNYAWALQGYPKHSVVAFSDIGARRDKLDYKLVQMQFEKMIEALEPIQVLYFTRGKTAPAGATIIRLPLFKGGEING